MIDVLLVLLIIFMVITPLTPTGLEAAAPPPTAPRLQRNDPAVVLELLANGTLRLNSHPLETRNLPAEITILYAVRADKSLFVKADQQLEYRQVARLIDLVKGANPSIQVAITTTHTGTQ